WDFAPRAAINFFSAEVLLRDVVAPVSERAFGEFHDVAFVHQGNAASVVLNRVSDRAVNQSNASGATNRLDPDADLYVVLFRRAYPLPKLSRFLFRAESNFREILRKFLGQKIQDLLRFRCAGGVFDPRVNIFRVFTEDYHVHFFRMLYRRGNALEVPDRPQTNVEIEQLPQGYVKRTNAAAHGSR